MRGGAAEVYFGGSARPDNVEGALDFMLWKHQADRLGITLTDADVMREIVAEAAGHKVFESDGGSLEQQKEIVNFFRNSRESRGMTIGDLVAGLREEFRVAIAQGIILGQEP